MIPGPPDNEYLADAGEVLGLAWVSLDELAAVAESRLDSLSGRYWHAGEPAGTMQPRTITFADVVPYPGGYHARLAEAVEAYRRQRRDYRRRAPRLP